MLIVGEKLETRRKITNDRSLITLIRQYLRMLINDKTCTSNKKLIYSKLTALMSFLSTPS